MICRTCNNEAVPGKSLCAVHIEKKRSSNAKRYAERKGSPVHVPMEKSKAEELNRTRARNRYRLLHGIDLDAPIYLREKV